MDYHNNVCFFHQMAKILKKWYLKAMELAVEGELKGEGGYMKMLCVITHGV